MIVVYKETMLSKVLEAVRRAKELNKTIDYIRMTQRECDELRHELVWLDGGRFFSNMEYPSRGTLVLAGIEARVDIMPPHE